ncbi:MAG: hypothetical protein AAGE03_13075, partial [Pseudomonadota bacterium]
HEPTLSQHRNGKADQEEKIKAKIDEILAELEPFFSSPIWGSNFGVFTSFDCECGFNIKRKIQFFEAKKELCCGNCGRFYDYRPDGDKWHIQLATMSFDCLGEGCDEKHTIGKHDAKPGFETTCQRCGSKMVVENYLAVTSKTSHQVPGG